MTYRTYALTALLALLISAAPLSVSAATKKTTCELSVSTLAGERTVKKDADILLAKGESLKIGWESTNAKKAMGPNGSVATTGSATYSPTKSTTYKYTFTGGKKVSCKVSVKVAEATLSTTSVSSGKPTLSGTATGTKKVAIEVRKDGTSKVLFKKQVSVKGGKWSAKVSKELSAGSYDITLSGEKKYKLNELASETLTVGGTVSSASSSTSSANLSVSTVPLLFGGSATLGASTPVAYLKISNQSSTPATFNGVRVKQTGSASTKAIIGLEVRDDKGVSRGIVNKGEGSTPFASDGTATAPASITLAAGETRLFTVRAILSSSYAYAGKTLMIDVLGLDGKSKGTFPLKGVVWTLR